MARYVPKNLVQKQYTWNLIYICSSTGESVAEVKLQRHDLDVLLVNYCGFAVPFLPIKLL